MPNTYTKIKPFLFLFFVVLFFGCFNLTHASVSFSYTLSYTISPAGFPDVLVRDYNNRRPESMIILKDGVPYGAVYFSFYTFINDNSQPIDGPIPDGDYTFCFPDRVPSGIGVCDFPDGSALADENGRFRIRNGEFHMGWGCTENCNSSVLFLPGIQGSRLYEEEGVGPHYCPPDFLFPDSECKYDHELWITTSDENHEKLQLSTAGKSINDIYTLNDTTNASGDGKETGLISETYAGINIYKSFLDDLEEWKTTDDIIEDYAFIPYDWRLSLEDIITNGQVGINNQLSYTQGQDFSESFILQKLRELQEGSRNGKVTLIGHSNGGLVIKALVKKLQETNDPLYEKIDKIILVATPQVGAPEATIALLHGIKLGEGFIMDADINRMLAENMPTVYNLNPSASYFTTVDTTIDPVITFEDKPQFANQIAKYGESVDTFLELKDYVLGGDGRTKPAFEDTKNPNIGNTTLFSEAETVHQMLDSWTPHPDTKVIQVAGWGEETTSGLKYEVKKKFLGGEYTSYKPIKVIDGDRTVPVPSALWMSDINPNVERWWVDLDEYNSPGFRLVNLNLKRDHKDILEILNLRNFIESQIQNLGFVDAESIVLNNDSTLASNEPRLHYTLHSPLTLGIIDAEGNYSGLDPLTGAVKNEIPDVTYEQIGEVQFLSVPADRALTLKLDGYTDGSFALDVEKQQGNNIVESTSFQGIPTNENTLATIDITPNMLVVDTELKIDGNGDNVVDKTLDATPGGVTVYDTTAPEISITFNQVTKEVEYEAIDDSPASITQTNENITATDEQGNTTVLDFIKYKDKLTRTRLKFNTITRNTTQTILPNTNIVYDWQEKHSELTDLDTTITIKGEEHYRFNYKKKANETVIRIRDKVAKNTTVTTVHGFVSVTITTDGDEVKIIY